MGVGVDTHQSLFPEPIISVLPHLPEGQRKAKQSVGCHSTYSSFSAAGKYETTYQLITCPLTGRQKISMIYGVLYESRKEIVWEVEGWRGWAIEPLGLTSASWCFIFLILAIWRPAEALGDGIGCQSLCNSSSATFPKAHFPEQQQNNVKLLRGRL